MDIDHSVGPSGQPLASTDASPPDPILSDRGDTGLKQLISSIVIHSAHDLVQHMLPGLLPEAIGNPSSPQIWLYHSLPCRTSASPNPTRRYR
jgi:hypothetical protein